MQQRASDFRLAYGKLHREIGKVIVGHSDIVHGILTCLFCGGHALLEGVPGLGKTLLVRTLSEALNLKFNRVQFTPDLMPSDIIGTNIINEDASGQRVFSFQSGPIFSQIVLADEINRATPKTQSALLEAMQEHSVTVGGVIHRLQEPFLVMATQNPIEQEGTYPLPEAQVDRFMLKLKVAYPSKDEELLILDRMVAVEPRIFVEPVLGPDDLFALRAGLDQIYMDDKIKRYIVDVVHATRRPAEYGLDLAAFIQYAASPRATIFLARAAKAQAFLDGRGYVTPQDVKSIGPDVLRHRISVTYEAEAEDVTPENLIQRIFDHLKVP